MLLFFFFTFTLTANIGSIVMLFALHFGEEHRCLVIEGKAYTRKCVSVDTCNMYKFKTTFLAPFYSTKKTLAGS